MTASDFSGRDWYRPGMSAPEIQLWEAAERAAAEAPEIAPTDESALKLRALYEGFPSWLAAHRAGRAQDSAA